MAGSSWKLKRSLFKAVSSNVHHSFTSVFSIMPWLASYSHSIPNMRTQRNLPNSLGTNTSIHLSAALANMTKKDTTTRSGNGLAKISVNLKGMSGTFHRNFLHHTPSEASCCFAKRNSHDVKPYSCVRSTQWTKSGDLHGILHWPLLYIFCWNVLSRMMKFQSQIPGSVTFEKYWQSISTSGNGLNESSLVWRKSIQRAD